MSSVATSGLLGPTSGLIPQVVGNNIEGENEISTHKLQKKPQDFDSETESDSSTDDEDDTSDDDKRLADNPILKERLKQLDRYATPIKHHTLSPVQIIDPHILPGVYVTNLPSDHTPNNGSLSIHGKSSGPSELMDSSLTPPEYRSRQLSLVESPTPCSGPASLNTSVTPKRNLSPPYAILCASTNVSGPTSQHEVSDISGAYPHLSSSLPYSEKKYHCQWPNCQRRFCSEETLNLHHRKHTGEKPFNCALCLYNCYDKPSLNEHYQLHHTKDTNIVYNSEDLDHQMASSNPSQHTSEKLAYRRPFDTRTLVTRTSTPVPTLRHRMADILDSCTSQVPGPLDAEINGILDSFDKEPDLPDLFSSGPLEVDRPATELKFTNNLNQNFSGRISPLRQNSQSSCVAALPPSSSVNSTNADSGTSESSFTSVLPNILSELQRAELSGSTEEFEKVKSHVLSVLPTFVIGDELTTQINEIVDEVNDALAGQPFHVIRAAFLTTRPFTHEESYMVDLLEQQMLSESSLIAPNPPRRRGRRPKLQQQLQPYLQRIFCLESGAAESMASHLVDVSQKDKSTNHYAYYRSVGFGRSRGHRGRGRSGKHLSLTTKLLSDESVSRTNHFNRSLYHPSEINMCTDGFTSKSRCGDIQGGYLTEQISSDMHPNFSSDINSQRNLTEQYHTNTELTNNLNHPNHLPTIHSHLHSDNYNYSNRRFHCPSEISPLEMGRKFRNSDDELDETQNNDTVTHTYMHSRRRSLTVHENDRMNDYAIKESHFEHSKNTRLDSSYKEREFLSQDTLGEMLEDLGVIVQQIGERAVVRKQQNYADGQPLNLSDFGNSKQGSGSTNNQPLHTKTEVGVPPIQLPSMATLASSSVSTPSIEGSTSGCISNAGLQIMSPHLSAASLHGVLSLKSHAYNQSGTLVSNAETLITGNPPAIISNASRTTEQSVYNSATNNYRRTAPVWSCESMCCSFTQENELGKADRSCSSNNFSPQVSQTRISQATGNYGNETNGDINQCFYPKDLSTRVLSFSTRPDSVCQSPISPKSFAHAEPRDRNFTYMVPESLTNHPVHLSSKTSSLGSLISATEAVDHLRSLSALGAKYTASLEPPDEKKYQSYQRLGPSNFSFSHSQIHSNSSPLHNSSEHNESVASQISRKSALIPATSALGPNIPSALNNLLYRGQKSSEYLSSVSGITSSGSNHDNSISTPTSATPTKNRSNAHNDDEFSSVVKSFDIENHVNTTAFGSLSDYSSAAAAAAAYHQLSRCANNSNNTVNRSELSVHNNYTSSSSPSMSVRSSLQELYQQQQQQLTARPPIQELTTRQLLSEAAATAYAHGLGRCDGQSSSGLSIPSIQQGSQAESLQCDNPYNTTGFSFSPNQYRYQSVHNNNQYNTQSSVSSSSRLLNEHILSNNNSASEYSHSNSKYLEHNPGGTSIRDNNYSLYPSHLPQTTPYGVHNALSRSMEEAQLNTTSQLVHSIHGVSGLAAAEAAAAAAYAYRQYHQQQTQATNRQNLIPQPPSAHTHYQNLLNQSNRSYYTGQIEENSSQRDLTLYTAHSERRDPKAAYLAETYRNAQVAPGRFFFDFIKHDAHSNRNKWIPTQLCFLNPLKLFLHFIM
ncbi:unnamed protein product [Heterobilharzia americana]|nr:unnamed protein product [Heterobilharzia americana]